MTTRRLNVSPPEAAPRDDAHAAVKALARKCGPLNLRDARALFDALYVADVLAEARGNVSEAARLAETGRVQIYRIQGRRGR